LISFRHGEKHMSNNTEPNVRVGDQTGATVSPEDEWLPPEADLDGLPMPHLLSPGMPAPGDDFVRLAATLG
jgi:hypothetical protein